MAFAQGAGELAQAAYAFGEDEDLFLAGDAGECLGGDAAQQRQAVAAAAHRLGDESLAAECLGERGLGVRERLGVDGRVDVDADVAEHDALDAGDFGQRRLVDRAAGVEVAQLAQQLEQAAVGLAAAAADRFQQLGQGAVGFEREWLGGSHFGHPGLHVLAGDAHEVGAVVDPEAVGVEFVEQVAGLARVEPFADHRLVAEREPDEHVELFGVLAAGGGGQQPAVGHRAGAELGECLVGLGGRVGVAQRFVGDQQVPVERGQLAGVAVEHAVGDQRDAGALGELAVEARSRPASGPCSASTITSTLGASGGSPRAGAPCRSSSRHWASSRPSATTMARKRGVVAARCASARPLVMVLPVPVWEASTPEPTTFSAASSRWRPSRTGSSASGRVRIMRTSWRAPASSVTFAWERLSSRSSGIACSATTLRVLALGPSAVVTASRPGRPFSRPTRTVSFSSPAASQESSSGRPCSIAVWTASPSSMTALCVAWNSSNGAAQPAAREPAHGQRDDAQRELGDLAAVGRAVAAAADEDAAPAVERVLGDRRGSRASRARA